MLDLRRDQVLSPPLRRQRAADDGQIVRLGAAGGEVEIFVLDLQDRCQGLPGLRDPALRRDAPVVHAGRISVVLQINLAHQRGDLRKAPGRRGVIEIDVFFYTHKSFRPFSLIRYYHIPDA